MQIQNTSQSDKIQRQKAKNELINYLPTGIAISGACVGLRAIKDTNRGDTFIKTVKNCAKDYTIGNKSDISGFSKFIGLNKLGKWIDGIGNKKMFALIFATDTIINAACVSWIHSWIKGNKD